MLSVDKFVWRNRNTRDRHDFGLYIFTDYAFACVCRVVCRCVCGDGSRRTAGSERSTQQFSLSSTFKMQVDRSLAAARRAGGDPLSVLFCQHVRSRPLGVVASDANRPRHRAMNAVARGGAYPSEHVRLSASVPHRPDMKYPPMRQLLVGK